eukprot:g2520.t1
MEILFLMVDNDNKNQGDYVVSVYFQYRDKVMDRQAVQRNPSAQRYLICDLDHTLIHCNKNIGERRRPDNEQLVFIKAQAQLLTGNPNLQRQKHEKRLYVVLDESCTKWQGLKKFEHELKARCDVEGIALLKSDIKELKKGEDLFYHSRREVNNPWVLLSLNQTKRYKAMRKNRKDGTSNSLILDPNKIVFTGRSHRDTSLRTILEQCGNTKESTLSKKIGDIERSRSRSVSPERKTSKTFEVSDESSSSDKPPARKYLVNPFYRGSYVFDPSANTSTFKGKWAMTKDQLEAAVEGTVNDCEYSGTGRFPATMTGHFFMWMGKKNKKFREKVIAFTTTPHTNGNAADKAVKAVGENQFGTFQIEGTVSLAEGANEGTMELYKFYDPPMW